MTELSFIKNADEMPALQAFRSRYFHGEDISDKDYADCVEAILTEDGEIISSGRLYTDKNGTAFVSLIASAEEKQSCGFASHVLTALIDRAAETGVRSVNAVCEKDVLPFLEKNSFCAEGAGYMLNGKTLFNLCRSLVFEGCEWLTFAQRVPAVLTRTEFETSDISSAVLEITALGYFIPFVNGIRLDSSEFMPAFSDYEPRDLTGIHMPIYDKISHRLYYMTYDISDFLCDGKNVLSCHIGAGWYGQNRSLNEGMPYWGDNKLVFRLTLCDNDGGITVITSDTSGTRWKESYIKETSLYFGEYHLLTEFENDWNTPDFTADDWHVPKRINAPLTILKPVSFPCDKEVRRLNCKTVSVFGDRAIYDIGETASGYAVIRFNDSARTNDFCEVRYADELNADGSLNFHYCGGTSRMQKDYFVFDEKSRNNSVHPLFTWHAGRYFEVTGRAKPEYFSCVQTDLPVISQFSSDNDTLNWIFEAYKKTQAANVHGCVPSDCPHRERLGYTGDGQLTSGAVMSVFDARAMYGKWIRDIADCQDIFSGHVQHTAPFYGGGGGPGGWGGAIVIVPYRYYKYYNDPSIIKEYYSAMLMYLRYMAAHCENSIVTSEEKDGWCLGDWCPPHNDVKIPEAFVNTYFLIKTTSMVRECAELLSHSSDFDELDTLIKKSKKALTDAYFNPETGSFCGGTQGADAFAIDIGIGDTRTLNNLVEHYTNIKTYDTGIFGTDIVTRVLFEKGFGSLAFELLTNREEASFYNMKKHGATTLWENWDGCDSRCHPMFGAVVEYFFSYILGIRRFEDKPSFYDVVISPAAIEQLKEAHGKMRFPYGEISVDIFTDDSGKKIISCATTGNITIHG